MVRRAQAVGWGRLGVWAIALVAGMCATAGDSPATGRTQSGADEAREAVRAALAAEGVELHLEEGWVALPAQVGVRDHLLEYLLVGPRGAAHESLFQTELTPSLVNTALLLLGFRPGRNAEWVPNPTAQALGDRLPAFDVRSPRHAEGAPGLHLYAGWREGEETYFYRVEDLIADLERGRSMRRAPWVFLGSRTVEVEGEPAFAADLIGNLLNISFFGEGVTLGTAALPECISQTRWAANPWLVPERGQPVAFVLAKAPIERPGETLRGLFPDLLGAAEGEAQREGEAQSAGDGDAPQGGPSDRGGEGGG